MKSGVAASQTYQRGNKAGATLLGFGGTTLSLVMDIMLFSTNGILPHHHYIISVPGPNSISENVPKLYLFFEDCQVSD